MPTYSKLLPNDGTVTTDALRTPPTSLLMAHDKQVAYTQIVCALDFVTKSMNIQDPRTKSGTLAFEVIYKNAVGTLKLQESVSGDYWVDIINGTTAAEITLADSGTIQSQIINLSVGSFAGNYLRASWDGAGTGWIAINVA